MTTILPYIQIALAIVMVALILMQQSEAGLGAVFGGGGDSGGINRTRRGAEKVIFQVCIVVSILFVSSIFLTTILN